MIKDNITILISSVIFGLVVLAVILLVIYTKKEDSSDDFVSKWLAVGGWKNQILKSDDGKNWSLASNTPFGSVGVDRGNGAAYGFSTGTNTIWGAVGRSVNGNTILYSTDEDNWKNTTGASFGLDGSGIDIAYGLSSNGTVGRWVAVGQEKFGTKTNKNILHSLDGISWEISTGISFMYAGIGINFGLSSNGEGIWVAGGYDATSGYNNDNILWSLDGVEWNSSTGSSFNNQCNSVAYGLSSNNTTGIWVAAGESVDGIESNGKNLKYSLNGQEWFECTGISFKSNPSGMPGIIASAKSVAYGLSSDKQTGIWVAGGVDKDFSLLYSLDGIDWQHISGASFPNSSMDAVKYGLTSDGKTGIWVATGNNHEKLIYSFNGQNWLDGTGVEFNMGGYGLANDLTNVAFKNTGVSAYLPAIPDVFPNYR